MKTFKLNTHQKTFSEDEVIIYSKDYPGLNIGDVIEVYSPDVEYSRLLLQVKSFPDEKENQMKDKPTISIEQSITATFQFRLYGDVIVNKIDANTVLLDSVEVIFKDQYLSRSDMWRTRNMLKNTVVFLNKKFEKRIRFQVFEMWSQGEKVSSGYINNDTKIVFRSASSMVYLFVQMSSEMWHFDVNGDLYFEKAVNGFLSDLFEKWKRFSCNHDVTIVLFSRTYYEANSIEEFPEEMHDCLQKDSRGKFYEDFYRVAIQNERYDEWNSTIIQLKKLFNNYQKEVLRIHEKHSKKVPNAYNSTASQGNFLEVLNMALNVFEKHYLDRSFDRTGQLSVVISPGVGVFEVDQDLTNITKQRIIDNGIGSDLVCLGEQPLHAVPLFKFNVKVQNENGGCQVQRHMINNIYNMPHWINLSFYTSKRQSRFSTFIPRIKMPNIVPKEANISKLDSKQLSNLLPPPHIDNSRSWFLSETLAQIEKRNTQISEDDLEAEYDKYDKEVFFSINAEKENDKSLSALRVRKKSVLSSPFSVISNNTVSRLDDTSINNSLSPSLQSNQLSNSALLNKSGRIIRKIDEIDGPKKKISKQMDELSQQQSRLSSQPSQLTKTIADESLSNILRQQCKSINPFNPKNIPFKLTSNRRRWTHVFPLGPNGAFISPHNMMQQQHQYRTFPQNIACTLLPINSTNDLRKTSSSFHLNGSINIESLSFSNAMNLSQNTTDEIDMINDLNQTPDQLTLSNFNMKDQKRISLSEKYKNRNYLTVTLANGSQNESENFVLDTGIITGVDWKSLIIPACLPLTTDYLPDPKTLENDYLDSEYSLLPEYQNDLYKRRCYKDEEHHNHNPLETEQVFQEFVNQRLQQGFQVIMNSSFQVVQLQSSTPLQANTPNMSKTDNLELKVKKLNSAEAAELLNDKYYVMSIGRIFHRLELDNSEVKIKTYRPRHSLNNNINIKYCYRFRAPDHEIYGVSWVDFVTEQLENYNWSYLDNYICLRGGEEEYELRESLRFWRLRMLLLPSMQQQTKQIIENISSNKENFTCDIYSKISKLDVTKLQEGFLKFFSTINRTRNQPKTSKETIKQQTINNPDLSSRRFSSGLTGSLRQHSEGSYRDRMYSGNLSDKRVVGRGLQLMSRNAEGDLQPSFAIAENDLRNSVENIDNLETIKKLAANPAVIIEAMKNGFNRFQFLTKQGNLPSYLFISADAVQWSIKSVEGIQNEQQALALFQKLLDHKHIRHASGQANYPFKYGFFLYYIVVKNSKLPDEQVDLEMYKREWFEVEISNPMNDGNSSNNANHPPPPPPVQEKRYLRLKNPIDSLINSSSSQNRMHIEPNANNMQTTKGTNYYKSVLDTDLGRSKSKRAEWLHIKYQQVYSPVKAFEIVLEWMVSTSNQIADIVQGWARKAGSTGLHLVPIPSDPFALPFYSKSDPLRAPIYVEINFDCLPSELNDQLLNNEDKLFKFREEILCRFGFLPFLGGIKKDQKQYVHVSGSIFVLILNHKEKDKKDSTASKEAPNDHEIYLTRHFSGTKQNKRDLQYIRTGFHWSWNYMISKRWKSPTTGDETFQRRVLKDFKLFCANDGDRLLRFAEEIQSTIQNSKSN